MPEPLNEALTTFTGLAVAYGLIRAGDKLDQNLVDFAQAIVERCAEIGDAYSSHHGNAGEHIRAELGEGA